MERHWKEEMCKSRTKVKRLPFPSFRKGLDRQIDDVLVVKGLDRQIDDVLVVKLNYKWGLFSLILRHDAAFCHKIAISMKLFPQKEN